MNQALDSIYQEHHAKRRGDYFLVNGEVRGSFLAAHVGRGKRVLDIGCRDGALTKYYAEGNDVTGLDIDSAALERAKKILSIKTIQADLNGDWPVEPGFDVVVACEILEHVYYPQRAAEKIFAVLKPEGMLLGSIPHAFSLQSRLRLLAGTKKGTALQDPTHINHFTGSEFKTILERAGFTDVKLTGIYAPKFKLFSKVFPYTFAHSFVFEAHKKKS